jgi:predicted HTH transcriptional regulator
MGDVDLAINRTGQALNQSITVGGQDVQVRFARAADVTDFAISNLDVSLEGRLGDMLKGVAQEMNRATAYLLADENGMSVKVAKYRGKDRVHLIESNEYGYCSLIKATKAVLDKLDLENKTASTITAKERIDVRLWNPVALREAVINAIVHNDYTREVPPKFEIFADRVEITSACALPEGLTQAEFFEGYSIPRNKELMRVFKDLEMVEHLGSGLPRITEFYGPECFRFTENFLRITFLASSPVHVVEETAPVTPQATTQVTTQVKQLLSVMTAAHSRQELQTLLGLANREHFRKTYLLPALAAGVIEATLPDKPNSRLQQYRPTDKGRSNLK